MELYTPWKLRGSWYFDSNKYKFDDNMEPYPEIMSDLKKVLFILIESKMLLPGSLEGKSVGNIEELVTLIETGNYLRDYSEFGIQGDTIIYTEKGEEIYSDIFCLEGFRTSAQTFTLQTRSDIWLPMAFDEDSYGWVWNLERYNLNYYRVPSVLKKINDILGWENDFLLERDHNERGSMQAGYDFFLSPEVITREYNRNPNPDFNLKEYLSKIE
jgi:hypothetical protein